MTLKKTKHLTKAIGRCLLNWVQISVATVGYASVMFLTDIKDIIEEAKEKSNNKLSQ